MPPRLLRKSLGIRTIHHPPDIPLGGIQHPNIWGAHFPGYFRLPKTSLSHSDDFKSGRTPLKISLPLNDVSESTSSDCVYLPILKQFDTFSLDECVNSLEKICLSRSLGEHELQKMALSRLTDRMLYLLDNTEGEMVSSRALLHCFEMYPECRRLGLVVFRLLPGLEETLLSDKHLVKVISVVSADLRTVISAPISCMLERYLCNSSSHLAIDHLCNLLKLLLTFDFDGRPEIPFLLKQLHSHVSDSGSPIFSMLELYLKKPRPLHDSAWRELFVRIIDTRSFDSLTSVSSSNLLISYGVAKLGGPVVFNSPFTYKIITSALHRGGDVSTLYRQLLICSEYKLLTPGSTLGSPRYLASVAASELVKRKDARWNDPWIIGMMAEMYASNEEYSVSVQEWMAMSETVLKSGTCVDMMRVLFALQTANVHVNRDLEIAILQNMRYDCSGFRSELIALLLQKEHLGAQYRAELVDQFVGRIRLGSKPSVADCLDILRFCLIDNKTNGIDQIRPFCVLRTFSDSDLAVLIQTKKFKDMQWYPLVEYGWAKIDVKKISVKEFLKIGHFLPFGDPAVVNAWTKRAMHLSASPDKTVPELLEAVKQKNESIEFLRCFPNGKKNTVRTAVCGLFTTLTLFLAISVR